MLLLRNDSDPPLIEAMLTRFDPDQIKYNKHFSIVQKSYRLAKTKQRSEDYFKIHRSKKSM